MQVHRVFQSAILLLPLWTSSSGLVSASPLRSRQSSVCTDANAAFDTSCWGSLNLGDFLTNSTTGWNSSTGSGRPCISGDNAAYCCRSTETWSSCFLRQSIELANKHFQCGSINSTTCPTGSFDMVTQVPAAAQPEHRYVLRNIYAIFQLFTSWQQALPQAIADAKSNIQSTLTEVDPQGRTNVNQSSTFQAFLLGFPLLASTNTANLITPQLHSTTNNSAHALLLGLQRASNVARTLYSMDSSHSNSLSLGDVQSYLATNETMTQLNTSLDDALRLVMSDLDVFVRFAGSGLFSGAGNYGVDGDDQGLDAGLASFVTSAANNDHRYSTMVKALGIGL